MRGRKKGENNKTKVLSIRITENQYELLHQNDWIRGTLLIGVII